MSRPRRSARRRSLSNAIARERLRLWIGSMPSGRVFQHSRTGSQATPAWSKTTSLCRRAWAWDGCTTDWVRSVTRLHLRIITETVGSRPESPHKRTRIQSGDIVGKSSEMIRAHSQLESAPDPIRRRQSGGDSAPLVRGVDAVIERNGDRLRGPEEPPQPWFETETRQQFEASAVRQRDDVAVAASQLC